MKSLNWNSVIKVSAWLTLAFMVACAFVMVFWEVHPFFLDEWAIIYNLKYKTPAELWGGLEKTQQFPRVYLQIIKLFSSTFNYSYTSLRLPSFVVHCCGMAYCIYLSRKLFGKDTFYSWLWVMIYAAYPASVFYFVLTKQYTMEMLLGLVGIAQLVLLVSLNSGKAVSNAKYGLLCISFLAAPMFSYTYPMVAAPMFAVVLLNTITKGRNIGKQWLALVLCLAGIVMLYRVDIAQVMQDAGMKNYWKDYYMSDGFSLKELVYHIWMYFYNFGRGPFMVFLGAVGLSAWLYSTYRSAGILRRRNKTVMEWLVLYSTALMWLSVLLFIAGKLPLNAHRLNAYKAPATGIMIVYLFMELQRNTKLLRPVYAIAGVLFVLQLLFIIQPLIRNFTDAEHAKKMLIYNNGKTAIATAQQSPEPMPIFTTSMTLYPHEDIDQADWVIKCYPLYDKEHETYTTSPVGGVPVFPVSSDDKADSLLHKLAYSSAVVTNGDSVWILTR